MALEGMEDKPTYSARARWESGSYSGISDILERFNRLDPGCAYDGEDVERGEDDEHFYDSNPESDENDDDDSSFDTDEEEEPEEEEWKLHLPIHGKIALRRSHERGEDPSTLEREQHSQLQHEIADKFGPLQNIRILFKKIDYEKLRQPRTRVARLMEGKPISPGCLPTLKEMNIEEYNEAYGIEFDLEKWLGFYDETVEERYEFFSISEDEFLEYNYWARRQSMPSVEGLFVENPCEGWPSSAPCQRG